MFMAHLMESSSIGTTITQICFRIKNYEHKTEPSKHIWQLKCNGTEFNLKWSIAAYATPYRCGTRRWDLFVTEKYIIAQANKNNLLNKRTKLISKCWHRKKYILKNIWHNLNWFTIVQLLAVAWKYGLFTELMLSSKIKHMFMAHLMESSSIGTTITQICFRIKNYEHKTEPSKHIWQLKCNGTEFNLKWSIAAYATPYRCGTRRWDLFVTEKYIIAQANKNNLLNKRTKLISKCRHRKKYVLKNIWHNLNWFTMEQFKS